MTMRTLAKVILSVAIGLSVGTIAVFLSRYMALPGQHIPFTWDCIVLVGMGSVATWVAYLHLS